MIHEYVFDHSWFTCGLCVLSSGRAVCGSICGWIYLWMDLYSIAVCGSIYGSIYGPIYTYGSICIWIYIYLWIFLVILDAQYAIDTCSRSTGSRRSGLTLTLIGSSSRPRGCQATDGRYSMRSLYMHTHTYIYIVDIVDIYIVDIYSRYSRYPVEQRAGCVFGLTPI